MEAPQPPVPEITIVLQAYAEMERLSSLVKRLSALSQRLDKLIDKALDTTNAVLAESGYSPIRPDRPLINVDVDKLSAEIYQLKGDIGRAHALVVQAVYKPPKFVPGVGLV